MKEPIYPDDGEQHVYPCCVSGTGDTAVFASHDACVTVSIHARLEGETICLDRPAVAALVGQLTAWLSRTAPAEARP